MALLFFVLGKKWNQYVDFFSGRLLLHNYFLKKILSYFHLFYYLPL